MRARQRRGSVREQLRFPVPVLNMFLYIYFEMLDTKIKAIDEHEHGATNFTPSSSPNN